MQPYQRRVIRERNTLYKKYEALESFQASEAIKKLELVDQNLLQEQKMAMRDYLDILDMRINRF